MNALHVAVLASGEGAAELLPVSSSAHVIPAEKLMGLEPTGPDMALLLVMLQFAPCSSLRRGMSALRKVR